MRALFARLDVRISIVYGIVATLWILLSDTLVDFLFAGNRLTVVTISLLMEVGFVVVTTAALYTVLSLELRKRSQIEQTLHSMAEQNRVQEAVHEREARFRAMIEVASEGIQFVGPDAHLTYINPQMSAMTGFQPEEMIGHEYFEFLHPSMVESGRQRFEARKKGDRGKRDVMIRHKNGSYIWVMVSAAPLFAVDGTFQGTLAMFTDIGERKRAEESLEKALRHEKELNELKTRFVAMASHEFRTPLAVIMTSSELLLRYRNKMSDQKIDEKLGRIEDQVKYLTHITEDVLELGRMKSGHLEFVPESLDFDVLCREVVQDFQNRNDFTQSLRYASNAAPVLVMLDKRLMRQVIVNLISNAIKYSASGSLVAIGLEGTADDAILTVSDQGIGIPEDDLKHVFETFHRATNVGNVSGTGLGLSISKQVVELHGGAIMVISEVGVGTTFTIRIPITKALNDGCD